MKHRDDTTAFLPLGIKIGGQINGYNRPMVGLYLTREQTNYVYRKTESGEIINTDTLCQELEYEKQLTRIDDNSGEVNPYKELIVNNAEVDEILCMPMEQWSILSNRINYIQYDRFPKSYHSLDISMVDKDKISLEEIDRIELNFSSTPDILKGKYLDVYEGMQSEIVNTTRFDEITDLSTTYLDRSGKSRVAKLQAEESFPISGQGYTIGKLLDVTKGHILLDTGASKSFMSKSYYVQHK